MFFLQNPPQIPPPPFFFTKKDKIIFYLLITNEWNVFYFYILEIEVGAQRAPRLEVFSIFSSSSFPLTLCPQCDWRHGPNLVFFEIQMSDIAFLRLQTKRKEEWLLSVSNKDFVWFFNEKHGVSRWKSIFYL